MLVHTRPAYQIWGGLVHKWHNAVLEQTNRRQIQIRVFSLVARGLNPKQEYVWTFLVVLGSLYP